MNCLQLVLSIILIITLVNPTSAYLPLNETSGNPSYHILSHLSTSTAKQGDIVDISIAITGVGDVDYNKFRVSFPSYIIEDNVTVKQFELESPVDTVPLENINDGISAYIKPRESETPFETVASLPEYYFKPYGLMANESVALVNGGDVYIVDENKMPLTFVFKIAEDAPAGDHEIQMILYYKGNGEWHSTEDTVSLHIPYWYESELIHCLFIVVAASSFFDILSKLKAHSKRKKALPRNIDKKADYNK